MSKELDDTIAHWRRLLDCKSPNEFIHEGFSGNQCPLCQNRKVQLPQMHRSRSTPGAEHTRKPICDLEGNPCPVFVHTGLMQCKGTPYAMASVTIHSYIAPAGTYITGRGTIEQAVKSIEKEIAFLEEVKDQHEQGT